MCGRYASFLPAEFIARLFATVNPLPNLAPTWNMAPTMDAPVVRLIDGDRISCAAAPHARSFVAE